MIFLYKYAIVEDMKQNYGERLATALKLRNFKQSDFARELNITRTAVSKIINGSQYLDFDLAVKACEILEISLNWLAYGIDPEAKPLFYRNPERQRIEYLMAIIKEAEYPLVIVAMEEIIEIRLKKVPSGKYAKRKEAAKRRSKANKGLNGT
jgi:transcriptional regulator with XRE-family HTH domain